jgi:hypothetical protein
MLDIAAERIQTIEIVGDPSRLSEIDFAIDIVEH